MNEAETERGTTCVSRSSVWARSACRWQRTTRAQGHSVVGDINPTVVARINREKSVPGEAHLADYLPALTASGALRATTDD